MMLREINVSEYNVTRIFPYALCSLVYKTQRRTRKTLGKGNNRTRWRIKMISLIKMCKYIRGSLMITVNGYNNESYDKKCLFKKSREK